MAILPLSALLPNAASRIVFCLFFAVASCIAAHGKFHGRATWYYAGIGACGDWNDDGDHIVALSPIEFAGGTKCGKMIRVHYQGRSVTARIVDLCPSCGWTGIDLSTSAFRALAPLDEGVLHAVWEYL
ncbi:hypothetical protein D9613_003897 [Agrocybe pediades]|uniref:RlpA-like protein double-psi beta-barrel domain-containing protein n=1 Tax=Agrocybe pediades TaxID=84607 RepID=A0A8H4VIF6_9AGAR|nr:hypothetical protein D9613_003897 [Agrocybe pediades]KAF9555750.1 hypothetical protein CPC08DRAFT_820891 [Agrocybe pediades]